ncbi:MAG: PAS domain S-box protein [Oligoflexia bacterium]|nr:PAS domain S-box protein [Oligoflexia bacterium]
MLQETFKTLCNVFDVGIIMLNSEKKIEIWNNWMVKHSSLENESVFGKNIFEIFPDLNNTSILLSVENAIKNGMSSILNHRFHKYIFPLEKNGMLMSQNVTIMPIEMLEDKTRYCLIQIIDMSASIRREEYLKQQNEKIENEKQFSESIISTMNEMLFVLDNENKISFVNTSVKDILQYSTEDLVGETVDKIIDDKLILKKIINSGIVNQKETKLIAKNGEVRNVLLSGRVMKERNGNITGIVCIVMDITEKIKMDKEKEEMQKRLAISSKLASVGELAAGVAHEINNPLCIIKGNLELMKDDIKCCGDEDESTCDKYIKTVSIVLKSISVLNENIKRIEVIVNGLRKYIHTDQSVEYVKLNDILIDTIRLLLSIYEKQGVKIDLELLEQNIIIKGNPGKLQQVLMNMLSNAFDAVNENLESKNIIVKMERNQKTNGEQIMVKIIDNGHGIKDENIEKIFDMFFTTKAPGKGTGMGLNICYSIVKDMHGEIMVNSKEGQGSNFTIMLPIYSIEK